MSQRKTSNNSNNNDITFYHYSRFENIKIINKNVYKADIKKIISQQKKTVAEVVVVLKCISLNNNFTLNDLINEVKRHRKLEISDNILKFYGITKHENTNNYMIVREYSNNGSLRQYLRTNFQKLDWNVKLNLSKQIANALMNLHSNNIIHGKLTSESILVHNGAIKLNDFGIKYLKTLFTTITIPIQYTDSRYLELFNKSLDIYSLGIILWEISCDENTNNYMIVREYSNNGSLRQYLRTNFQKLDWNVKLNLSKQIANALMNLHSNNIIHGKLTSESILVHNGAIKLNDFGIKYLKTLFTTITIPIQYTDSRYLELFNKSLDIYSLGIILWEISCDGILPFENESLTKLSSALSSTNNNIIDLINDIIAKGKKKNCLKHHGNSRPDIIEVVSDLSEINIVSDINLTNNLEKPNEKVQSNPPHINFATTTINNFNISVIKKLFEFYINLFETQSQAIRPIMMNDYIKEHNLNSVKILHKMIRYSSNYWFTSLIGFFYQNGIGTVIDNKMAFKFFCLAANERIFMKNISSNLSLRKFYNINKEIGIIRLAHMYCHGLGVERDLEKCFQIYSKAAGEGSHAALSCMANCYEKGHGVEKNKEKAFELFLKSEKGDPHTQFNVGTCFRNGSGIAKDETKGLQWFIKSALSGNIDAIYEIGHYYDKGICVDVDKNEAFKWYFKGAEKGDSWAQYKLGIFYEYGNGIDQNQVKAFEWYKKAAENGLSNSQYRLGECFYDGYGTKKDIVNAIYWLNKANENEFVSNGLLYEIIELYNHNIIPH
ncbi:hypothetical protein Glove_177g16 [Diversispora epigaea]|uniref:Protein kinase domain-containing protein n=1 Tax=Diversispora epigaea TaxID=1348612 RepID=A0A397IXB7_9GLOM|nr:hypothetical protein Glove_177g16 [Diversispora epigaea]